MIATARAAMADFFNCDADEVFFGQNMTTITFALARGIGRELKPGDEIVVTTLDHDANVAPWRALEESGVVIRQVDIREADCTLDLDDLRRKITSRTKLVAVGYASNAVGTINPVAEIVETRARRRRARVHRRRALRAAWPDRCARARLRFSRLLALQIFRPAHGRIYGKREQLLRFQPYKVRPAPEYAARPLGNRHAGSRSDRGSRARRLNIWRSSAALRSGCDEHVDARLLVSAYRAMRQHEMALAARMIRGLLAIPGLRFYGITDPARFAERCSRSPCASRIRTPIDCAKFLGDRGIFTWDGNYYALNLDRTSRRREKRRPAPHRPRALQHRRRSRPPARRSARIRNVTPTLNSSRTNPPAPASRINLSVPFSA